MGFREFITPFNACDVIAFPYNPPRSWLDRRRLYRLTFRCFDFRGGGKSGLQRAGCQVTPG